MFANRFKSKPGARPGAGHTAFRSLHTALTRAVPCTRRGGQAYYNYSLPPPHIANSKFYPNGTAIGPVAVEAWLVVVPKGLENVLYYLNDRFAFDTPCSACCATVILSEFLNDMSSAHIPVQAWLRALCHPR